MPKGTDELKMLLAQAAARVAEEKEQAGANGRTDPSPAPSRPAPSTYAAASAYTAPPVEYTPPPARPSTAPPAAPYTAPPAPPAPPAAPAWASSPGSVPPALPQTQPGRERDGRGRAVVVGAVIGGLLLAGGGVGVLLASSGGPSKADYVKKADAACQTANAPVVAIGKPTSYPELATSSGAVVTATRGQVAQLRKLDRPGGSNGAAALAVVDGLDATSTAAQRLQDAANAHDDAATITATNALGAAFNDTKAKSAAYGLTACGIGMTPGIDTLYAGSSGVVKTAFIAKADSLCRTAAEAMDNVSDPSNGSGREVARYFDKLSAIGDKLLADLRALAVPPGDEATVADMFATEEKADAKARELSAAASAEDVSRFLAVEKEVSPLSTAAAAKFDAYGLGVCGSNFGDY